MEWLALEVFSKNKQCNKWFCLCLWKTTHAFKALAFAYKILPIHFFFFFIFPPFPFQTTMLYFESYFHSCLFVKTNKRRFKNYLRAKVFPSWPTHLKATQMKCNYNFWSKDSIISIVGIFLFFQKYPGDIRSYFKIKQKNHDPACFEKIPQDHTCKVYACHWHVNYRGTDVPAINKRIGQDFFRNHHPPQKGS